MGIGQRVRDFRERQNLTQTALAGRVGVHQAYIANIENGSKSPSIRTVVLLAAALGVTPNDLLVDPAQEAQPTPA